MAEYVLVTKPFKIEIEGEIITTKKGSIGSDIFESKEVAQKAQNTMLSNWGIETDLEIYESEPENDGYDLDRYY